MNDTVFLEFGMALGLCLCGSLGRTLKEKKYQWRYFLAPILLGFAAGFLMVGILRHFNVSKTLEIPVLILAGYFHPEVFEVAENLLKKKWNEIRGHFPKKK